MSRAVADLTAKRDFDVIIVGAGASGCVLASRLSEVPDKRILLLEAGPDAPPGHEHADILDPYPVSSGNPRFLWPGLVAEAGADLGDGSRVSAPYSQGFGVGGSSNVNGMFADRGIPSDYDEWRDLGAVGWGWADVLPYFKKLEHDADFAGPLHGQDGPIPIRRLPRSEWAPFAKALATAFGRRGALTIDDSNGEFLDGLSAVPQNCLPDRRVSASMAYLTRKVRQRPNLTLLVDSMGLRLQVTSGCVRGVEVRTLAGPRTFVAAEVILACGAVQSPALLLRSGIGPAEHLRSLGIPVIRDLRGVGHNLQNHSYVSLAMHLRSAGAQSVRQRTWLQNLLRYSSKLYGCAEHDMLLLPSNKGGWHPLGQRIAALAVMVSKAYSKGSVELVSADPDVAPNLRFNLFSDRRDFERLVLGLRMALEVLSDTDILKVRNEVFSATAKMGAQLARRSAWNWLQAWLIAAALRVGPLRRAALRSVILDVHSMAGDDEAIRGYVRENARVTYHACGTCRMGSADKSETVVDPNCRVLGIEGLRVVDASVFPSVTRACTHLPVLMVAEKIADRIKAQWLESASIPISGHPTSA
jgi:5-(hydroxymethyl)furfural/furfural oxidase